MVVQQLNMESVNKNNNNSKKGITTMEEDKNKNVNNTDHFMAKGTMTIETFMNMVKDALASHLRDCTIKSQEVKKNNGVILHGLCIMEPESNIAPVIYLDNAFKDYQNGRDFHEIVTAIAEDYKKNHPLSGFDATIMNDYVRVKDRICFKVINTALNSELLSGVPHIPFWDLAVVFYILLDSIPGQNASIMVQNSNMIDWEVDTDILFKTAKANTQRLLGGKVMPMKNVIEDALADRGVMTEERLSELENCGMYIATNNENVNGAVVLLYDSLLSGFADKVGADFYIIPSSVHELIFMLDSVNMKPEDIRRMICEVNSTVDPEEILSDNVYIYRRETGLVEII